MSDHLYRTIPFATMLTVSNPSKRWTRTSKTNQVSTFPPGHNKSPIPDLNDVHRRHSELFDDVPDALPEIELDSEAQLALLPQLAAFLPEMPFTDSAQPDLRFKLENPFFSHGDALVLDGMLRLHRPRRYVEIGSGWSSALVLDVRNRFFDGDLSCIFVDPNPQRLDSLLRSEDRDTTRIYRQPLQEVWREVVAEVRSGDFLFVDSTHVGKIGSDVLVELHEMVPSLPAGVHVHFHNIFFPFEYRSSWIYDGRYWNEAYLLRCLLMDNRRLKITWWNSYLTTFHADAVSRLLPGWDRNQGGSIWLQTTE